MSAKIHGPFQPEHRLSVDGYEVPHITAIPLDGENDGILNLILDRRIGITAEPEEVQKWIPFIANAMAVAAGYTSHGANCERANPFKVKLFEIGEIET